MKRQSSGTYSHATRDSGVEDLLGLLSTMDHGLARRVRRIFYAACEAGSSVSNSRPIAVSLVLCSMDNSSRLLEAEVSLWWHAHQMRYSGSLTLSSLQMNAAMPQAVSVTATRKEK